VRWQGDRPPHCRAGTLSRVYDLACGMIQHAVIEGLEPDADVLTIHIALQFPLQTSNRPRDFDHFKDQPVHPLSKGAPVRESPLKRRKTHATTPRGSQCAPRSPWKARRFAGRVCTPNHSGMHSRSNKRRVYTCATRSRQGLQTSNPLPGRLRELACRGQVEI